MGNELLMQYARELAINGFLETWPLIGTVIPIEQEKYFKQEPAGDMAGGRSLSSQFRDRKAGRWPPLFHIGNRSVGYLFSHLLILNASRQLVTAETTIKVAPEGKKGRRKGRKPRIGGTPEQQEAKYDESK